ncbi:hypothetical protein Hypma_003089, partial [Hypsizygus marmoreus]
MIRLRYAISCHPNPAGHRRETGH